MSKLQFIESKVDRVMPTLSNYTSSILLFDSWYVKKDLIRVVSE